MQELPKFWIIDFGVVALVDGQLRNWANPIDMGPRGCFREALGFMGVKFTLDNQKPFSAFRKHSGPQNLRKHHGSALNAEGVKPSAFVVYHGCTSAMQPQAPG